MLPKTFFIDLLLSLTRGLPALLLGLFALVMPGLAQANPVGEVIFAIGEVKVVSSTGSQAALAKGDRVSVGDTFTTGPGGHLHIRFVDQAFVSVRPGSELKIEDYVFDSSSPEKSRVKFSLSLGTSRLITGKAGQAAKQNFRVNTPISAIGIRGTDFVVQTTRDVTRIAVYQGAVVAAPFDTTCSAAALGPCGGALAKDLSGSLTSRYLEIKPSAVPELIQPKNGAAGRIFVPANPNEPAAKPGVSGSITPATGERLAESRIPAGYTGSESIIWGRWSAANGLPAGYELIAQQGDLALLRAKGAVDLPAQGRVDLRLDASSFAYGSSENGELKTASVKGSSLGVNFNSMQYATKFRLEFDNQSKNFFSRGAIQPDGRFEADRLRSNIDVSGSLDLSGKEAAYLFLKRTDLGAIDALGVLHWKR